MNDMACCGGYSSSVQTTAALVCANALTGPKRSALNIDDIIRLLHEKGTDTTTFVARDLGKLPPVTFDSIDVSALLHSIRQNEAAINVLKDCVTKSGL